MTFKFLRNDVYFGCAAQLSTKRRMFLFCPPILASNERRNVEKMSVFIHALLFTWYLDGNFFIFLKHRGFGDFPITIGTCLSLPSLLTQSKTVIFPRVFRTSCIRIYMHLNLAENQYDRNEGNFLILVFDSTCSIQSRRH
jgi:hypothetical protein